MSSESPQHSFVFERLPGKISCEISCGTYKPPRVEVFATGNPELSVIHQQNRDTFSLRKEVIQPQVLLRLPCYDFTPIMSHTLGLISLAVRIRTSSTTHFRDVTGGVYKARERIHRGVLIRDY